ncbi:MAG TPA: hydantoinase B/oxoprolinase family protein [Gemmatimonadota bacterium]|nr:hydantoinase B/oxoprolinase family protein [Gemmatimonadota bacterium]
MSAPAAERSLFAGLLAGICDEMLETLVRTAYSPNIKERRDCSTALFDGRGRLVAQAAAIPVHLGAMPMSVATVLQAVHDLRRGDVIVLNDPFRGGTHLPDITMVSPVFASEPGTPFAFLATRAHHADVGGFSPGSMGLSREIYQEGLRIPPVRLIEEGRPARDVWEIVLANVRTPDERRGDLRAQVAAHETGAARIQEAIRSYGPIALGERTEDLLDYAERLMRAVVRGIPDGDYTFEDQLDGDGFHDAPVPICVRISVTGEEAVVDFTGSAPECEGGINAVEAVTRSAVYYAFLCLLATLREGDSAPPREPPLNAGCFRPIRVVVPAASVVNAGPPCAVAGGNVETSQRIVDVVLGALAGALPEVVSAASQGTMNNLTVGGLDPRTVSPWAFYETIAGGTGAGPSWDGADGVHSHMTNTWNTPIEAVELAYPLRVERYEIRRGTGGLGKWRGGNGIRRDIRVLADARGALLADRRTSRPYGLQGGACGEPGEDRLLREGREIALASKTVLDLRAGDVISVRTPGGGGWGPAGGV